MQKTFMAKSNEAAKKWWVVDLEGKTLGRAATKIADILRGKDKPQFTRHADAGDFVVVLNADKIHLSGQKWDKKFYHHYSGFAGGMKSFAAKDLVKRKPGEIVRLAVQGMIPKTRLGRQQLKKLKIYTTAEHPHQAQQPEKLELA